MRIHFNESMIETASQLASQTTHFIALLHRAKYVRTRYVQVKQSIMERARTQWTITLIQTQFSLCITLIVLCGFLISRKWNFPNEQRRLISLASAGILTMWLNIQSKRQMPNLNAVCVCSYFQYSHYKYDRTKKQTKLKQLNLQNPNKYASTLLINSFSSAFLCS